MTAETILGLIIAISAAIGLGVIFATGYLLYILNSIVAELEDE